MTVSYTYASVTYSMYACLFVNYDNSASTVRWKRTETNICIWLHYLPKWRQSTNPNIAPATHTKRIDLHTCCPRLPSQDQANKTIYMSVSEDVCAFCWVIVWVYACLCIMCALCVPGSVSDHLFITKRIKLYNANYGNIEEECIWKNTIIPASLYIYAD